AYSGSMGYGIGYVPGSPSTTYYGARDALAGVYTGNYQAASGYPSYAGYYSAPSYGGYNYSPSYYRGYNYTPSYYGGYVGGGLSPTISYVGGHSSGGPWVP